ncbi:bifunctional 2',3'-cyclic-nucleotide 2'-phosphodiesterase/3'-nucleotidase [Lysinibacillus louembei]|uniref:Bifunctional 2',3'-cyclic-nucleotide 2'-phosphodiesterase/3'-nucleotidase n=1 Tax=Lysinibacillus louembei TaxID=1470088 RepID=A0ABZ0S2P6_9BACI|nr:bifunctional 2',3'-cyclic-nucleotide 2'-phosphodiesterase/3'-nucleotidase [Lysinibacillus louembei]WPK13508.1 bifunctional 2',3'-cyclic-nucleotide 2'-phosphodiesterase/3'-nucleotidase [Lysinibacillus louembei]
MKGKFLTGTVASLILAAGLGGMTPAEAAKESVTRGDYVVQLIKELGVELGDGSSITFKDVSKELAPYVEKAVELNLIHGKSADTFAPDEKLTRLHAFVIAARGLATENAPLDVLNQFTDNAKIHASHKQDMANAAALEILNGFADGTISHTKIVTEQQMELIVKRFVEQYNKEAVTDEDEAKVALRILGTSDIHTNLANYNYYLDKDAKDVGLANTATLIDEARNENPNNLLFDNGDLIQGTPLGSYKALEATLKQGEVHPAVAALNTLGYDAATLGNHEFNYGLDYLNEVMDDAEYTWVNANVRDAKTGDYYFEPYAIIEREVVDEDGDKHVIKVGVTGIVPTQILGWDAIHLTGKVTVDQPVDALEKVIPDMEAAGADVIVVLSHSGIGSDQNVQGNENVGYQITELEGVDAVITGHSHLQFPGDYKDLANVDQEKGTINGVPTVMPGAYGSHLGVIDLELELEGDEWVVTDGTGEIRSINREGLVPSKDVLAAVKEAHEGTLEYIRRAVGETAAPINSYFGLVQDTAAIEIITQAQTWFIQDQLKDTADADLPMLSAGAPFKAGSRDNASDYTNIPAGPLAIKNMADIYHYDNTVATVKVTGADVIEWLEMAAGVFATIDPAKTEEQNIIDPEARSYNFDVLDGVTYEIDVTSPAKYDRRGNVANESANRIKNVQFDGKPIDLSQEFLIIVNNYRVGGSYGAQFVKPDQSNLTVYAHENRQAIIDYIIEKGTINPQANNNWKFVDFPANTKVVFQTADVAKDYIPEGSNIEYIGPSANGFGKFQLK